MWLFFAVLSSVFAALTSILAKVGIEGVNSNLDGRCAHHGLGNGISHRGTVRAFQYREKELALPDPVGPCHRGILAVLL